MHSSTPIVKHLVLVGGGHTHALVIRVWAMKPMTGVRVTLISPNWQTPYSGMLPGLLAGHYQSEDIHIDLRRLCTWAGVRFIEGAVTRINPEENQLQLNAHPAIHYDTLSLDIGSTPDLSIPGLKEFAQPVKPINLFYPRYLECIKRCRDNLATGTRGQKYSIAIVGGGAGGVEVALAMTESLSDLRDRVTISLAIRGNKVLPSYSSSISEACTAALRLAGISIHFSFEASHVEKASIHTKDGLLINADDIFFCTQAKAATWPTESGLTCDQNGFIKVNEYLQSLSHSNIFAAGDIAAMQHSPRPKAGVYAVRQAPILLENLKLHLLKRALKVFIPQDSFMSLISLGSKTALLSRNNFSIIRPPYQHALWRLKNYIDQKFMSQFRHLPERTMVAGTVIDPDLINQSEQIQILNHAIRCAGCGSKVGGSLLRKVLPEVTKNKQFSPEDAAIFTTPQDQLIQTVDQITSPIDNPYLFGQIACLHALSDAFAMNATPISLQVILNLPYAAEAIQEQEMSLVMKGLLAVSNRYQCNLLGGHTAETRELSLGVVVNAIPIEGSPLFKKENLQVGDHLVLTKAIGTGVILAADMHNQSKGEWHKSALTSMLLSNKNASALFSSLGVLACTDVTGFGLAGHLSEMLEASHCSAELSIDNIPCLEGAVALSKQGIKSSLFPQNYALIKALSVSENLKKHAKFELLFDPQTSGGLLAGVNDAALEKLQTQQDVEFTVIGRVVESLDQDWCLTFA